MGKPQKHLHLHWRQSWCHWKLSRPGGPGVLCELCGGLGRESPYFYHVQPSTPVWDRTDNRVVQEPQFSGNGVSDLLLFDLEETETEAGFTRTTNPSRFKILDRMVPSWRAVVILPTTTIGSMPTWDMGSGKNHRQMTKTDEVYHKVEDKKDPNKTTTD